MFESSSRPLRMRPKRWPVSDHRVTRPSPDGRMFLYSSWLLAPYEDNRKAVFPRHGRMRKRRFPLSLCPLSSKQWAKHCGMREIHSTSSELVALAKPRDKWSSRVVCLCYMASSRGRYLALKADVPVRGEADTASGGSGTATGGSTGSAFSSSLSDGLRAARLLRSGDRP